MNDKPIESERRNKSKDKFKEKKRHPYKKNYKRDNLSIDEDCDKMDDTKI